MERAAGRIIIMPGGDITARNAARIVNAARPAEIHFAALEASASGMTFRPPHMFMGGALRPPEFDRPVTAPASVRAIIAGAAG